MKSLYPLIALAALAACNQSSSPDAANTAASANTALANTAAPLDMPPAIRLQKSYRCGGDNSLVYVTWFVGDEKVNIRDTATGTPTELLSATGTSPWTSAVGATLAGDDQNIRVATPDKGIRDCHA